MGLLGRLKSFLDVGGTKADVSGEATLWTQAVFLPALACTLPILIRLPICAGAGQGCLWEQFHPVPGLWEGRSNWRSWQHRRWGQHAEAARAYCCQDSIPRCCIAAFAPIITAVPCLNNLPALASCPSALQLQTVPKPRLRVLGTSTSTWTTMQEPRVNQQASGQA